MLNSILKASLQNRLMVLVTAGILSLCGLFLAWNMNVDVFPDLTAPTVTIMTEASGLESEEVEKLVSYQLETAMNGAPNVRRIRSSSAAGVSIVWVEFEWGTEIFLARQIVSERISSVRDQLPDGIGIPIMTPISSIMGEVMLLGMSSDSLNPIQLRTLADWTISPRIKSISGIANVTVMGGGYKQFQVLADPLKLRQYGVSLQELHQAVEDCNLNASGGFFNEFGNQYVIKGSGRTFTVSEIEQSVLKHLDEQSLKIGDVATVQIGAADKIGDASINEQPALVLSISKQPSVNTLKLTEQLDLTIEELRASLPKSVQLHNHIFRQANFIEASIKNLNQTLFEGAAFVVLILFLFLMNWRTTLISLLSIPISLLLTIIVLKLLGYSINTMVLGGMAIAVGALVDDAIIDVENVYKGLRENIKLPKHERRPSLEVVRAASMEVRSSIIIATMIIIVSFVPLFFLGGMEGRLLKPLGIAFITSVLSSLLVAVSITPVLCSLLLHKESFLSKHSDGSFIERTFIGLYKSILPSVLRVPRMLIGSTIVLFAISLFLLSQIGRSFLPAFNEGSLVISLVGTPGMSMDESNRLGRLAEAKLLAIEEIQTVTRRVGRAEADEHVMGVNSSEIDAPFELAERSKEEFFAEVREELASIGGLNVTLGQPIAHRIDHMMSGTRANIAIKIFGPDLQDLFSIGKKIEALIKPTEGLVDLSVEQQIEVPQIRIKPKRQLLAAHGMTIADLMGQVEMAFGGRKAGAIYEGQKHSDLITRFKKEARTSIQAINSALIQLPDGGSHELGDLATIESVSSPNRISRENVQRKIVVSANVEERDLNSVVAEIKDRIREGLDLPESYRISYEGQFEAEQRASTLLMWTSIIAIGTILFLLFLELKGLKLALIVLLNLPLALIGGVVMVYFTSGIISIASTIGFISLFGIATRNGILMISRFEDLRHSGMPLAELVVQGALDRLNPILMTTLTTGLALIPLALKASESGSEIQSPMAQVILGGLVSSTLLNLLVIPCVYSLLYRKDESVELA